MDSPVKNMDFLVKHWAGYPRRLNSPFPLQAVGYLPAKQEWIRHAFTTYNFSLILRGVGIYRRKGRTWPVQAPCVITQSPGDYVEYGATPPGETWSELYLIYDAAHLPALRRRGFVKDSRPIWPIRNPDAVQARIEELRALTGSRHPEMIADRVDSVCERLVMETLLPEIETGDEVIQHIVISMRQHPGEIFDMESVARRHGMSLSTLRRRWFQSLRVSPGRYLLNLRIQCASRLLAETRRPVGEIAAESGFEDPLYFSRRFKLETHLTPLEYRRRYRVPS